MIYAAPSSYYWRCYSRSLSGMGRLGSVYKILYGPGNWRKVLLQISSLLIVRSVIRIRPDTLTATTLEKDCRRCRSLSGVTVVREVSAYGGYTAHKQKSYQMAFRGHSQHTKYTRIWQIVEIYWLTNHPILWLQASSAAPVLVREVSVLEFR